MKKPSNQETPEVKPIPETATPDVRTIGERFNAIKGRLQTGCITKNGSKIIFGNKIDFVMSDDLMELVRGLLADEGLDVDCSMHPRFPPKEIQVKTAKGMRLEWQCWFVITTTCPGPGGQEYRQRRWWCAQDADTTIAGTLAFKAYLLKRLQLSGGNGDGIDLGAVEALPQAEKPWNKNLSVTPENGAKQPKATGAKGPSKPDEKEPKPNDPAPEDEVKALWKIWCETFGNEAKVAWQKAFPKITTLNGMSNAAVQAVWTHLAERDK
jgi:hypothetical protein